jgi:hypothetical protein
MTDDLLTQIANNFVKHSSSIIILVVILLCCIILLSIWGINLNPKITHNIGKVVTVQATT